MQTKIAGGQPRAAREGTPHELYRMNISSLSSLDSLTITSSSQSGKSHKSNPLNNTLNTLEKDLASGDTSDAASLLSTVLSNAPGASSKSGSSAAGSGASGVGDQITSYLQSIQSAVASGDTSKAQSILTKLNSFLAANPPPQGPSSADGSSNSENPLEKALDAVGSDLKSGDTSDASSLISDLLSNAPGSSSKSDSSADSSGTSSVGDQITTFLKSLQSALSSNDTKDATSILSALKDYLNKNMPSQSSNSGTYSSDGTLSSATSSTASVLSELV